jgi:hypothetical protein
MHIKSKKHYSIAMYILFYFVKCSSLLHTYIGKLLKNTICKKKLNFTNINVSSSNYIDIAVNCRMSIVSNGKGYRGKGSLEHPARKV